MGGQAAGHPTLELAMHCKHLFLRYTESFRHRLNLGEGRLPFLAYHSHFSSGVLIRVSTNESAGGEEWPDIFVNNFKSTSNY